MRYKNSIDNIILEIDEQVEKLFYTYVENYDFAVESGGILIGTLNPAYNSVRLTNITEPFPKDIRTQYEFKRSEDGHQNAMNNFWEQSNFRKTYLGEWHTHNQKIPQPSHIDIKNWLKISKKKNNNSEWIFFIIIGTEEICIWTIQNKKIIKLERIENY